MYKLNNRHHVTGVSGEKACNEFDKWPDTDHEIIQDSGAPIAESFETKKEAKAFMVLADRWHSSEYRWTTLEQHLSMFGPEILGKDFYPKVLIQCKYEILRDILHGPVSSKGKKMTRKRIRCFSDLHDYVDANMYGESVMPHGYHQSWTDFMNRLHNELNVWIKGGWK